MRRLLELSLLFAPLITHVTALEPSRYVDIHVWPLSDQKSQLLASLEYNSTSAIIQTSYAARIPDDEKIVRVGFYQPGSTTWSGIVTAAGNFGDTKEKTILLNLDAEAVVYHVGFRATDQRAASQADLRAEVVPLHATPEVYLNKPVVLDAAGQLGQPPEKSFLQKYWWVIAAFLLLQVFMGGGSDKKE